jgi:hypothetical protein
MLTTLATAEAVVALDGPNSGGNAPKRAWFSGSLLISEGCSVPYGTVANRGVRTVRYGSVAAVGLLVASAIVLPSSEAVGPPYYAPPPAYYPQPGYYAPGYYTPPGYYYFGPPR